MDFLQLFKQRCRSNVWTLSLIDEMGESFISIEEAELQSFLFASSISSESWAVEPH